MQWFEISGQSVEQSVRGAFEAGFARPSNTGAAKPGIAPTSIWTRLHHAQQELTTSVAHLRALLQARVAGQAEPGEYNDGLILLTADREQLAEAVQR